MKRLLLLVLVALSVSARAQVNVTFQVHLGNVTIDPAGAQLAGAFNGWSDQAMTSQGGGIYTLTLSLAPGAYQYKFKNGPGGWENVTAACGVSDGFGGYNREVVVGSNDITLPLVAINNCGLACNLQPNAIICDDFETYTLGILSPQAAHWAPWSGAETNAIVNSDVTDAEASNGTKSMVVQYEIQGATQGNDQLLLLGNKTTGRYELKWKMYIPSEHAAYYNIQNSQTAGQQWNLDVYFDSTGQARIDLNSSASQGIDVTTTFPFDVWFEVRHVIDLDNNLAKLYLDGNLATAWGYTGNIGAVDYYAATAWDLNYVDELEYVELQSITFDDDECSTAVDITPYFGGAPSVPVLTPLYDNSTATTVLNDPLPSCFEDSPQGVINNSVWFTFTGDGRSYNIETVECTAGANYIDDGDTQMALYTGDCGNLTEIACNEDIDFDAGDYRAGLFDFETAPGAEYRILIDGWSGGGLAATGAFCIQITRLPDIECNAGVAGTFTLDNNGFICPGLNATDILTVNAGSFVLPTVGPLYGMAWAVTQFPIAPGTFPTEAANGYVASTGLNSSVIEISFTNANITPNIYYLTPIVIGGAIDTVPATAGAFLHDIDVTDQGCFHVGESQQIILLPALDDLIGVPTVTDPNPPNASNGSILLDVEGGFPPLVGDPTLWDYSFEWTGPNGYTSTDQNIAGLSAGVYSVTVTDPSNCVNPLVITGIEVGNVATKDPASVARLQLSPNPTAGALELQLELKQAAEVRVDVLDVLGQTLQSGTSARVQSLRQSLDLSLLASGTYFVRLTIDGETALRRVVKMN